MGKEKTFKVTRDCCLSGNCICCIIYRRENNLPFSFGTIRRVQTYGLSKKKAEEVAKNWERYNSKAEEEIPNTK